MWTMYVTCDDKPRVILIIRYGHCGPMNFYAALFRTTFRRNLLVVVAISVALPTVSTTLQV
jgi:hypothetical protein